MKTLRKIDIESMERELQVLKNPEKYLGGYTYALYESMLADGTWAGGYVDGIGYVGPQIVITGNYMTGVWTQSGFWTGSGYFWDYEDTTQDDTNSNNGGNGAFGNFSNYDDWFNSSSSEQRFANNSNVIVWFKPESTMTVDGFTFYAGDSYPLLPGKYTIVPIDGFCYGSTVVKLCDGYNTAGVNINTVNTDYSPFGAAIQLSLGGPIDDAWLSSHQNQGWESLFNRRW